PAVPACPLAWSSPAGGVGGLVGCRASVTVRRRVPAALPGGKPGEALPARSARASSAAAAMPAWLAAARRQPGGPITTSPALPCQTLAAVRRRGRRRRCLHPVRGRRRSHVVVTGADHP